MGGATEEATTEMMSTIVTRGRKMKEGLVCSSWVSHLRGAKSLRSSSTPSVVNLISYIFNLIINQFPHLLLKRNYLQIKLPSSEGLEWGKKKEDILEYYFGG